MHLAAIDLETTGLDPLTDQILEIGIVTVDMRYPKERRSFRKLVNHTAYMGNPIALSMNAGLLKEIGEAQRNYEKTGDPGDLATPEELPGMIAGWLESCVTTDTFEKWTPTGKNVGSFDLAFLRMLPGWSTMHSRLKLAHRCLDPGPLYFMPSDNVIPDLKICKIRAGLKPDVAHTALTDCNDVLDVIFAHEQWALHLKSGHSYGYLGDVINATNSAPEGQKMALYRNAKGEKFVREKKEFEEKFTWS